MKGLSQLFSLVVACLSFLVVSLTVFSLAFAPTAFAVEEGLFGVPHTAGAWVAVVAAGVVGFYGSFPMARCIGRFFPVRLSGKSRIGLILTMLVTAATWLFVAPTSPALGLDNFVLVVPLTTLILGTVTWTLVWQTRSVRSLNTPFILYLRRFSSFSDRSLMAAFLRARGRGYRAVFLAPVMDAAANLGPMVTAFSGTRFWKPLASCPLPVAARNLEWEEHVERLARAAACVVIDVSDRSQSIALEMEIVKRCTAPERILWLAERASADGQDFRSADRVVRYRRSWPAATLRVVLEFLAVGVCAVVWGGGLAADDELAASMPWLPFVVGIALVAIAAPVIVQPSVNRGARRDIRDALREILASPPALAHASIPFEHQRGARSCVVLAAEHSERAAALRLVAERARLQPVMMRRPTETAALHRSIRQLRDAALVVADLSQSDADVEYFLGIAHGLGRKVVLVSAGEGGRASLRGAPIHRLTASDVDMKELTSAVEAALLEPLHQGPVAAVLADYWVFGDDLAGRRVMAFLFDATVSAGIAFGYVAWRGPESSGPADLPVAMVGFFAFLVYQFFSLVIAGTTPGMALAGIRVIDADGRLLLKPGQALGRCLATYLAILPFGSALTALFAPRYQILEDTLSGTRVVRRGSTRTASTRPP